MLICVSLPYVFFALLSGCVSRRFDGGLTFTPSPRPSSCLSWPLAALLGAFGGLASAAGVRVFVYRWRV